MSSSSAPANRPVPRYIDVVLKTRHFVGDSAALTDCKSRSVAVYPGYNVIVLTPDFKNVEVVVLQPSEAENSAGNGRSADSGATSKGTNSATSTGGNSVSGTTRKSVQNLGFSETFSTKMQDLVLEETSDSIEVLDDLESYSEADFGEPWNSEDNFFTDGRYKVSEYDEDVDEDVDSCAKTDESMEQIAEVLDDIILLEEDEEPQSSNPNLQRPIDGTQHQPEFSQRREATQPPPQRGANRYVPHPMLQGPPQFPARQSRVDQPIGSDSDNVKQAIVSGQQPPNRYGWGRLHERDMHMPPMISNHFGYQPTFAPSTAAHPPTQPQSNSYHSVPPPPGYFTTVPRFSTAARPPMHPSSRGWQPQQGNYPYNPQQAQPGQMPQVSRPISSYYSNGGLFWKPPGY